MQIQINLTSLAELLFPSLELSLEAEREWAARNIVDYHCTECRVIPAQLAYDIKESDPEGKTFYVQVTGDNGKTFILWRANVWLNSRHRKVALRNKLETEKRERDLYQAATGAELAHRKLCVEWLSRVASKFCDINIGYKVSFLRDSFHRLASRVNYDMDILFTYLTEILDEETLRQVWVGAPQRKTNEQTKPEEVSSVPQTEGQAGQAVDQEVQPVRQA